MDSQTKLESLKGMFHPQSVAVIGATNVTERAGYNLVNSLIHGGFSGHIYPVHPRLDTLLGLKVYHSLAEITEPLDLAIIALNERGTVDILKDCGEKGAKGALCFAGGYRETSEQGAALEEQLRDSANRYHVPLIGPNTFGIISNDVNLNATPCPMHLPKGGVSFITQSGGVGLTFLHRAADAGLGINKWICVGNRCTFDFADYLAFLGQDSGTRVIGLMVEGTEKADEMVRAAADIGKPVVVYKVGRTSAVNFASMTHTGSMVGSYQLYHDIFQQYGLFQVTNLLEMIATLKGLAMIESPRSNRIGIVTHTAGPSILAIDELLNRGHSMATLTESTLEGVRKLAGPNPPFIAKNPLDVTAVGWPTEPFGQYLELLAGDPNVDIVLAFYCQQDLLGLPSRELIRVKEKTGKPMVACYASRAALCEPDRELLESKGIPLFTSPEEAAWAIGAVLDWTVRSTGGVSKRSH